MTTHSQELAFLNKVTLNKSRFQFNKLNFPFLLRNGLNFLSIRLIKKQ